MRVSDVIGDDYKFWGRGIGTIGESEINPSTKIDPNLNSNNIIIRASTGTGKTYFVLNKLLPFVVESNQKMVYFTNRTNLLEQINYTLTKKSEMDNVDYHRYIRVMNYHEITKVLYGADHAQNEVEEMNQFICRAKFLIFDEAQYFLSDCEYNESIRLCTEKLVELRFYDANQIWVFMTATPDYLGLWLYYFLNKVEERKRRVSSLFHVYVPVPSPVDSIGDFFWKLGMEEKTLLFPSYSALEKQLLNQIRGDKIPLPKVYSTIAAFHIRNYLPQPGADGEVVSCGHNIDWRALKYFSIQYACQRKVITDHLGLFVNYNVSADYSYITPVYYERQKDIIEAILHAPVNERWLIFVSNKKTGGIMVELLEDKGITAVLLTKENKRQKKGKSARTYKDIREAEKFEPRVLIATNVLDNGVNISDSTIHHVVIDFINKTTFLQMLGRRRIDFHKKEKINLYLRDMSQGALLHRLKWETLGKYFFCDQFTRLKAYRGDLREASEYREWFIHSCFSVNGFIKTDYMPYLMLEPEQRVEITPFDRRTKEKILATHQLQELPWLKVQWDMYSILHEVEQARIIRHRQMYDEFIERIAQFEKKDSLNLLSPAYIEELEHFWDEWVATDEQKVRKEHLWLKIQLSWIDKELDMYPPEQPTHWYTEVLGIREKREQELLGFLSTHLGVLQPEEKEQLQVLFVQYQESIRPCENAVAGRGLDAVNKGLEQCGLPYFITKKTARYWEKRQTCWCVCEK